MSVVGLPVLVGRRLLALVGIALVGAIGYATARARAEEDDAHPTARLVYERDAVATRCPDDPELRDLVAARLGYVPFSEQAPLVVTTRIEGTPRGLRATVEVRSEDGTLTGRREIVSRTRDCQELARGVALAISVAIDPFVLTGGAPPVVPVDAGSPDTDAGTAEPSIVDGDVVVDAGANVDAPDDIPALSPTQDVEAAVEADAGADAADDSTPVSEATPGLRLALGGAVGVGFGAVPDPRPYFAIDVAADHPSYIVRGVVRADLPAEDTRPIGGSVRAWRLLVRADACGAYRFLFGCGGVGARLYVASGDDIANARSAVKMNFALTPQVGVRLPITDNLRVRAAFGIDLPLGPISLELDERAVFREWQVSPFLEVGIVWRIP